MNLYEINNEILECVDAETGEIFDEEKYDALSMERDAKMENILLWIKNLNADIDALKNEKKSFEERIKSATNKRDSLKNYIASVLEGNKFKTDRVSVTWRKSESVEITDIDSIPDELLKYREPEADKTEIKKLLKLGHDIEGAELITNNNIQIK